MTYQELVTKAIAVIKEPEESTVKRFLETMKQLPEPEDTLDASLRRLLVDMAVKEYLSSRSDS